MIPISNFLIMNNQSRMKERKRIIMAVFSMRNESLCSIELIAYVIGIKEETVIKILTKCENEYKECIHDIYKRHNL